MNKVTMKELVERAEAWESDLSDTFTTADKCKLSGANTLTFEGVEEKGDLSEQLFGNATKVAGEGMLNIHAQRQLGGRLQIPSDWLFDDEKCPEDLRGLVANWKLERAERNWLIRQRDNGETVRGILSDEYRPYNHFQFVQAIDKALAHEGLDVEVLLKQFSDEMRAYIILPQVDFGSQRENRGSADGGGNGGLHPAIYTGNSEIGTSKVRIGPGGFRGYCANGQVYGWRSEAMFSVIHRFYSVAEMELKINEAIIRALKFSEESAIKFMDTVAVELNPQRVGDLIDEWAGKYGVLVDHKELWKQTAEVHVAERDGYTLFDVINDASFTARDVDVPWRAETMERMAGDMVYATIPQRFQRE